MERKIAPLRSLSIKSAILLSRGALGLGVAVVPAAVATAAEDQVSAEPAAEFCEGRPATIIGTPNAETLVGTEGPDVIAGMGGADDIAGMGGNDVICGGNGDDHISGGNGNDRLFGESGSDIITGSFGVDLINGAAGDDRMSGNQGTDTVKGGPGNDKVFGEEDADKLYGGDDKDLIIGGTGNDYIHAGLGTDVINGGSGTDTFPAFSYAEQDSVVDNTDGSLIPRIYDRTKGPKHGDRADLTFDDCPKSLAQMKSVVQSASRLGIGLVLAPTGNCISAGRFDAAFARRYGHTVINHSVSHPNLTILSDASVRYQLGSPGVVTNYGRPPGGAINARVTSVYASLGMKPWTWSVDTNDWRGKTSSQIVSYVSATARNGDTVLMHMQHNGFNEPVLKSIRDNLARRGVRLCRPYPIDASVGRTSAPVKIPASGLVC